MDAKTISKIINSIGLCVDIAGVWLVAIEVVKQYKGKKFRENPTWNDVIDGPKESLGYEKWQILNHKLMLLGLALLTLGFLLQVVSNWIEYLNFALCSFKTDIIPLNPHE